MSAVSVPWYYRLLIRLAKPIYRQKVAKKSAHLPTCQRELNERFGEHYGALPSHTGRGLIWSLPRLIRVLAVVGTLAMLLVGGGIFVHHIESLHHLTVTLPSLVVELGAGLIAGLVVLGLVSMARKSIR